MIQLATQSKIIDVMAAFFLVTAIIMVGSRRMNSAIYSYIFNSLLLALVTASVAFFTGLYHLYIAAFMALAVKSIIIPFIIFRVVDRIKMEREIEPFLSIPSSLIIAGGIIILTYYVVQPIPSMGTILTKHILPVSIAATLIGLFLMISRKRALLQALGLMAMENGIFLAAVGITYGMPLVVELGIFFDLVVGAIILGIFVFRMNRTFDSVSTESLERLKE